MPSNSLPAASSGCPMEDFSTNSLTSLPTRIHYIKSFLSFTPVDAAALHAAKPLLAPLIPTVVDLVYTKLLSFSITAQSFVPRQPGYTGTVPTDVKQLSLEHPQISYRKDFLAGYISKLVTMDYEDIGTWEYLDRVGLMHTGIRGDDEGVFKHRKGMEGLRVEYVHCGLLLGYVEEILTTTVISHPDLDTPAKVAVVKAMNKLIWIQNDLFARHYVNDLSSPAFSS